MKSQDEQWLLDEKYQGEESAAFFTDYERLKAGEPLAYVIGWTPFLNTFIYLDSKPLIPRYETEYWTELAIVEIKKAGAAAHPMSILDLCAGSGAIGVAVAKAVPDSMVTFAEIDPTHLPTIERNLSENLSINRTVFAERFQIVESNLFAAVPGSFDFILTNPPYIDPALDRTEASVKEYEPARALYGGVAGMHYIEQIIKEACAHLTPQGQLWIEHEPEQTDALKTLATQYQYHITTHNDQYQQYRFSVLSMAL